MQLSHKQGTYLVCPFLWCTFMFSNLLLYSSTCSSKTFLCHLLKIDRPYVLKLLQSQFYLLTHAHINKNHNVVAKYRHWTHNSYWLTLKLKAESFFTLPFFFFQHTDSSIIWAQCLYFGQLLAISMSLYMVKLFLSSRKSACFRSVWVLDQCLKI